MAPTRSPITCHVLDASIGKPAKNVQVSVQKGNVHVGESYVFYSLATGSTDDDGRCSSLIPPETILEEGVYKVVFETQPYFESTDRSCFYPFVEINFNLKPGEHFHIPLLISPFSYTTYRGS